MPHVSTHYRIYLGAAHHRRPRNPQAWAEPDPSEEVDVLQGGVLTPFAPQTLAYTPPGGTALEAGFLFWSLSDGSGGRTQASRALTETVGSSPLTLIAWYYLPPSPGGPGGPGTAVLIDAYSVQRGDFVDDDFVTVTSNPSLSLAANVDGSVSTSVEESVQAYGHIPTGEGFDQWVTSPGGTSAAGDLLTAPAGSEGLAIATYRHTAVQPPKRGPEQGWIILFGITNDGSGIQIPIGGGPPVPIGPWGPLVARMLAAMGVYGGASSLSKEGAARIQEVAAAEIAEVAQEIARAAQKGFRGG